MEENKIAVNISKKLHSDIELRVKQSNGAFKSVDDYIEFVLMEFLKQEKKTTTTNKPQENKEIKERLRKLGYM